MRAVWLENQILSFRSDVPEPEPAEGEALVKVRLAGICGTDLALINGYHAFTGIPGHEFVGEIVRASAAPQRIGQRVVGEINISCGSCRSCLSGRPTHCKRRAVLGIKNRNGAFADYLCLPLKNLIPIPEAVCDDAAVFAEPLAAALRIQQQIKIAPADCVLVIGAGRLGQLIARTLVPAACELTVAARYKSQQALLAGDDIAWIQEKDIPQGAFDVVIEATGTAEGFLWAGRAVRPRGTIVLKSTYPDTENLQVNFSSLVVDEITLVGSRCGPLATALDQLDKGLVDPTLFIEQRYFLNEAPAAFKQAAQSGSLKILFRMA